MFVPGRVVREKLLAAGRIPWKPPGGQHDTTGRAQLPPIHQPDATDAAFGILLQTRDLGRRADFHPLTKSNLGKPSNQRVATDKMKPPSAQGRVPEMNKDSPQGIQK